VPTINEIARERRKVLRALAVSSRVLGREEERFRKAATRMVNRRRKVPTVEDLGTLTLLMREIDRTANSIVRKLENAVTVFGV